MPQTDTAATADPIAPDVAGAPLDLFDRWEQQQWHLIDFDFGEDREGWGNLRGLVRQELRGAIENFLVGEGAVTETLAPLVHAAPTPQEQFFLTTQLVDEARHTLFFARYLAAVEDRELKFAAPAATSLTDVLQGALRDTTSTVRERPWEKNAWYRAIVVYHLLIEGVLAVSGMRSLLGVLRDLEELPMLASAVTNVARDESRHIGFGVTALRAGVAAGYADVVGQGLRELVPPAVRALINPDRTYPRLLPESATRQIATDLERLWGQAERALIGRAERIGLGTEERETVRCQWARAREDALDEYQERHGATHPVRHALISSPTPSALP